MEINSVEQNEFKKNRIEYEIPEFILSLLCELFFFTLPFFLLWIN